MNLTILQKEDMQQVASMNEIIEADKLALKLYSEGKAQVPLRANLDVKEQE